MWFITRTWAGSHKLLMNVIWSLGTCPFYLLNGWVTNVGINISLPCLPGCGKYQQTTNVVLQGLGDFQQSTEVLPMVAPGKS
jgi:hypothetical protein